jgi:hypothetical protein
MMRDYLADAIRSISPNSEFTYSDEDYSTINWIVLEGTAPTLKQVNDEITRLKAEDAAAEAEKANNKAALLAKLGITADEAALLLS